MTEKQLGLLKALEEAMQRSGFNTFYAFYAEDVYGKPIACFGVNTIEEAKAYVDEVNRETRRKVDFETGVTLVLKGFKGEPGKPDTWTDYREHHAPKI